MAIEIARQLKVQGERTEVIFLFDSWAAYPEAAHNKAMFNGFMQDLHSRLKMEFKGNNLLNIDAWIDLQWQRANLLWNYTIPEEIHEKLILFKAKDLTSIFKEGEKATKNYWEKHCKDLFVYNVPGDHESIFEEPNVNILAKLFDDAVAQLCETKSSTDITQTT